MKNSMIFLIVLVFLCVYNLSSSQPERTSEDSIEKIRQEKIFSALNKINPGLSETDFVNEFNKVEKFVDKANVDNVINAIERKIENNSDFISKRISKLKKLLSRLYVLSGDIDRGRSITQSLISTGDEDAIVWYIDSLLKEEKYEEATIEVFKSIVNESIYPVDWRNLASKFLETVINYKKSLSNSKLLLDEVYPKLPSENDFADFNHIAKSICLALDGFDVASISEIEELEEKYSTHDLDFTEFENKKKSDIKEILSEKAVLFDLPFYKIISIILSEKNNYNSLQIMELMQEFYHRNKWRPEYISRMVCKLITSCEALKLSRDKFLPLTQFLLDNGFADKESYISNYYPSGISSDYWRLHLLDLHMMNLFSANDFEGAKIVCERIIEESSNNNPAKLNALNHLAWYELRSKNIDGAINIYETVITMNENSSAASIARMNLAHIYKQNESTKFQLNELVNEILIHVTEAEIKNLDLQDKLNEIRN